MPEELPGRLGLSEQGTVTYGLSLRTVCSKDCCEDNKKADMMATGLVTTGLTVKSIIWN